MTYDSRSEKIIGIRGKVQSVENLAFEWSAQAGNLRIGVAAEDYAGGVVTCNFWNVSSTKIIIATFDIELRDSKGAIIPSRRENNHLVQPKVPDRAHLPNGHLERVHGPGGEIPAGESGHETHWLKFWYGHLPDGAYTLRVTASEAGSSEVITTPPIPLTISKTTDQRKRSLDVVLY